jgi:Zn-dependent alcohol dehydrogenase
VLVEPGRPLEVREIEVQAPKAGEVLVRMAAGGVCHTDLHVMQGLFAAPRPAVLGHEGAGVVAEVGPGVTSVKPGDHVVPLWRIACGECEYCTGERPALCPSGLEVRRTGRLPDGTTRFSLNGEELKHFAGVSSFSEYSVIPEKGVLAIPKDIPLEKAALLGCAVITGFGAVAYAAKVRPGTTVAVIGAGGVGLNVIQAAALAGAERIIAVDLLEGKLTHARAFGATHAVRAEKGGDPVGAIRELTGGRGVDYAFDVVGLPATVRQAYLALAKRGVAVAIGIPENNAEVSVPIMSLVYDERVLTGSLYGSARPRLDIPRLIGLYRARKLKLDELLTRTWPLAEINEAYAALERGEVARSVVTF